jgi:peptidoglycan/xylan/chitin deacetylase (PgdA/CDA1 family)
MNLSILATAIILLANTAGQTAWAAPAIKEGNSHTTMTTTADTHTTFTYDRGGIIRGRLDRKEMALIFTGGSFAEGGDIILDALKERGIKGSFFFTGDFFRKPEFKRIIERVRDEGHYLGPHSDAHPLYASWDSPPKLLISREDFDKDLDSNMKILENFGVDPAKAPFFIPPYEHYTQEISDWTAARGMVLFNFSPGTRTNADYMEDTHPKYISSEDMVKGVMEKEAKDPAGLNGFMMLIHIGAGPARTKDHLFKHMGAMIDELRTRGYQFVRVDEMLAKALPQNNR